jgi:hypothetical protein
VSGSPAAARKADVDEFKTCGQPVEKKGPIGNIGLEPRLFGAHSLTRRESNTDPAAHWQFSGPVRLLLG